MIHSPGYHFHFAKKKKKRNTVLTVDTSGNLTPCPVDICDKTSLEAKKEWALIFWSGGLMLSISNCTPQAKISNRIERSSQAPTYLGRYI